MSFHLSSLVAVAAAPVKPTSLRVPYFSFVFVSINFFSLAASQVSSFWSSEKLNFSSKTPSG